MTDAFLFYFICIFISLFASCMPQPLSYPVPRSFHISPPTFSIFILLHLCCHWQGSSPKHLLTMFLLLYLHLLCQLSRFLSCLSHAFHYMYLSVYVFAGGSNDILISKGKRNNINEVVARGLV